MNITAATTELLTADQARRLIARARDAAVSLDSTLLALWDGKGHAALGYPATAAGWRACCAENLPELRTFALRAEPRAELAQAMHRGGASVGVIAGALGVSKSTAHAAVVDMPDRPATVTSADGRVRGAVSRPVPAMVPASAPSAPAGPFTARLVDLLRSAGPLTAAEVERRTRVGHGAVSAALHRLAAAGRVTYHPPVKRGGHGHYSVPALP